MQREENRNVTHTLKKRRARGSLVGIWVVLLANAKFWSEKPHAHPRTMLAQKKDACVLSATNQAVISLHPLRTPPGPESKSPAPL